MSTELVKDFTKWMDEGFEGVCFPHKPEQSIQRTKPLMLANGISLSIQAGVHQYCEPTKNSDSGSYDEYEAFEVGFPSEVIPDLLPYAEDDSSPTRTIYLRVPKELLRKVIADAGGVVGYKEQSNGITDSRR